MRTKTESRRQAILDTAAEVFREHGFNAASMSEISSRLGGSKATLYSYFASKEELFITVIFQSAEGQVGDLAVFLDPDEDPRTVLEKFGRHFIGVIARPTQVHLNRCVYAEAGNSEVGRMFFSRGPQVILNAISGYLQACKTRGRLRDIDTQVAAKHLVGLLRAEILEPVLYGVIDCPDEKFIAEATARAVDVFLNGYTKGPATLP